MTAGSETSTGQPAVIPDPEGTAPGRGAHLHPTTGCYDLAVRRKAFSRALRVTPGPGGLTSVPVEEYLTSLNTSHDQAESTDRNWSNSS